MTSDTKIDPPPVGADRSPIPSTTTGKWWLQYIAYAGSEYESILLTSTTYEKAVLEARDIWSKIQFREGISPNGVPWKYPCFPQLIYRESMK